MNDDLYNEARNAFKMLRRLEVKVKSLKKDEIEEQLYGIWRKLQRACITYTQQGPRLPLTSKYLATCPLCKQDLLGTEELEIHLNHEHSIEPDDAEAAAAQIEKLHIGEIDKLRELLPKHTGVMIEDEDPFLSQEEN